MMKQKVVPISQSAYVRRPRRWGRSSLAWVGAIFGLPATIYFAWWIFSPMLYGIWLAFTNENWLVPPHFVGLSNFSTVFADPQFWQSAEITLLYAVEVVIPGLLIALVLAILVNTIKKGHRIYLTAFFLPFVVPSVASSIVFEMLMQPGGLIDQVFHLSVSWLTNSSMALVAVAIVTVWNMVGYYVVIFLAALQQVSNELVEAGRIDGTSMWQSVRYIVLPLIRPTLLFALVTATAVTLTNFTQPYVLTNGGPGVATTTLPLLIYKDAFQYSSAGQASAVAIVLLVFSLLLTWTQFRIVGSRGTA
jgi:ABC-type sugar transport system permease subunit